MVKMRRTVLLIRDLLSSPEGPSLVKNSGAAISRFAQAGTLAKVLPSVPAEIPKSKGAMPTGTAEATFLGLNPSSIELQDGPLIVSALGADPPDGSVHFHLSLMSFDGTRCSTPKTRILPQQIGAVLQESMKLNTKKLTIVAGEQLDHGLVWEEGSIELGTLPVAAFEGNELLPNLPEGDGEPMLRRFIDDSTNLLSQLPINREREEEGLPPLNLLWPWGQGFRTSVPNLALRRGEVCHVLSRSLRLQGLTQLTGYRHGDRKSMGYAVKLSPSSLLEFIRKYDSSLVLIDAFAEMREFGKWDEMDWMWRELDTGLFRPLFELSQQEPLDLTVIALSGVDKPVGMQASELGLSLSYKSGNLGANSVPFDERALEERALRSVQLWEAVW